MNISIKCRCGTQFIVPETQIEKLDYFSCSICKRQIPSKYIDKIKSCLSLIDECHIVYPTKTASNGMVDLGKEFTIDFVE